MPIGRTIARLAILFAVGGAAAHAATYDAIAIDDDTYGAKGNGDYAVGQGPTAKEAQRVAMSNCTLGGNVACGIKLTYQHCGAYASSHQVGATGVGGTPGEATAAALAACGSSACRLVVADCVDTPLRPPS